MIPLAVLWILWCALHSLLISRGAHGFAERVLGSRYPLYRLFYTGFSAVTLVPVLWYHFSLEPQVIVAGSRTLMIVQLLLLLYGLYMLYAGAKVYDMGYFLGLKQWRSYREHRKTEQLPFHTDGVLAYIRHPWYSGGIAILWGVGPVTDVYLLTRGILTMYFIIGTLLEESRLKKELGEQYIQYCRRVPMLIPWKIFSVTR